MSCLRRYVTLCEDAASVLEDPTLSQALVHDLRVHGWRGFFAKVQCTIKTHKPQGKVVARPIHASVNHPFAPAMRWIASLITTKLRSYSHLVLDSSDLVHKLKYLKLPPDTRALKIDV